MLITCADVISLRIMMWSISSATASFISSALFAVRHVAPLIARTAIDQV
jgi:hypothetical protein